MTPSERRSLAASLERQGLEPLDARIVGLRLGLEDGVPRSRPSVAGMVGLSPEDVGKRERAIIPELMTNQISANIELAAAILKALRQPEGTRQIQGGRGVDQIGAPRRRS